ncbi:MAG: glycosyltransferase family 2 protein [Hyphomonadaceae bacterium]|nr:glycosyltransferase family 2 protein [Hyphomonadaceae bacterium]
MDLQVSVVAPCFNEEDGLHEFHRRVSAACAGFPDHEIVLVDDGSKDSTWSVICALAESDPHVRGIKLSRNFGHQAALTAGLASARGARIMMIDADLQDPPELLGDMMKAMDAGADVVYGKRTRRQGESAFKRASAAAFYRVIGRLSEVDIPVDTGDFRLVDRRVLDALLSMPERYRFVRGMIAWIGFRQVPLEYVRDRRYAGTTNYTLARMIKFSMDAITGFSTIPLQFAHVIANLALLIGLGTLVYIVWSWFNGIVVPGWTSLLTTIAIFSSLQMFVLGVIGDYLGRMYMESKGRPLFIVAEQVGGPRAIRAQHAPALAEQHDSAVEA